MDALAVRHFERRQSASARSTLLAACEEVGLDPGAAAAFLDTDELEAEVWRSYGSTIREKGIHAIPYFVFNGPGSEGGPFRAGVPGEGYTIRGSANPETFLRIYERILAAEQQRGAL